VSANAAWTARETENASPWAPALVAEPSSPKEFGVDPENGRQALREREAAESG
jgi:hypothetical protein